MESILCELATIIHVDVVTVSVDHFGLQLSYYVPLPSHVPLPGQYEC